MALRVSGTAQGRDLCNRRNVSGTLGLSGMSRLAAPLGGQNVHHLALDVDITYSQTAQLGAADPGRIERHQHRTVK